MTPKFPFDFTEMTKAFDPERVAAMFDPNQFMAAFGSSMPAGMDPGAIMQGNKRNFEAMVAANKAAAEAYRDFYEKQMAVFTEVAAGAQNHIQSLQGLQGAELAEKQAEIMSVACEQAFTIMSELAESGK